MNLSDDRLVRLGHSLDLALNQEWPKLEEAEHRLGRLDPIPIAVSKQSSRSILPIATVATDGGENRLNLNPIHVQIVRVADSLGRIYFEEFIAQSLSGEAILRIFSEANPEFRVLVRELGVGWKKLLPISEFQKANLLSMLRELMEWAALLKIASQGPARLLIRDGLLRSVLLSEETFRKLRSRFEALTFEHGHLLVGVAKRSQVINYLSVALDLNEAFADGDPAWVAIPPELEQEAAPAQYRWIGNRATGWLCIARLDRGVNVPLLPIDVAVWQKERVAEVMTLLHESARGSFPIRGYPAALSQAHEHARIGGLDIAVLENLLLERLAARSSDLLRKIQKLRLTGGEIMEEAL